MKRQKRTYSLPSETVDRFERRVSRGHRSTVVNRLVERWVQEEEKTELRDRIIEGCRDMGSAYLDMEHEFHALEEEAGCESSD